MKPELEAVEKKKPYRAMKLTVYGDLRDLTAQKPGTMGEGQSIGTSTMH